MPHDSRMMAMRGHDLVTPVACSLRWPYQANVMNTLEMMSRRMVSNAACIGAGFNFRMQNYKKIQKDKS